jgi:hypothetical protein
MYAVEGYSRNHYPLKSIPYLSLRLSQLWFSLEDDFQCTLYCMYCLYNICVCSMFYVY